MNKKKEDESRQPFLGIFKKTILKIILADKESQTYLVRYTLFTCPWFSIKLHKILLSDDDCMHDHPWSFISIILKGGYYELTPTSGKWYRPGSILWRPQPWIHKLVIPECKSATTLVITFKKVRQWGFVTPSGWKVWYSYIREGRRCE